MCTFIARNVARCIPDISEGIRLKICAMTRGILVSTNQIFIKPSICIHCGITFFIMNFKLHSNESRLVHFK